MLIDYNLFYNFFCIAVNLFKQQPWGLPYSTKAYNDKQTMYALSCRDCHLKKNEVQTAPTFAVKS